jgi:hypothetical protein
MPQDTAKALLLPAAMPPRREDAAAPRHKDTRHSGAVALLHAGTRQVAGRTVQRASRTPAIAAGLRPALTTAGGAVPHQHATRGGDPALATGGTASAVNRASEVARGVEMAAAPGTQARRAGVLQLTAARRLAAHSHPAPPAGLRVYKSLLLQAPLSSWRSGCRKIVRSRLVMPGTSQRPPLSPLFSHTRSRSLSIHPFICHPFKS